MKKPSSSPDAVELTAQVFHKNLQSAITDSELHAAYGQFTQNPLDRRQMKRLRDLIGNKREILIERLADELGRGNDVEPRPRVIRSALESAGYPSTRNAVIDIQKKLREKYGDRWENASGKKFLRALVSEGELELWEALRKTYDMDNSALLAMLLRTFVLAANTNRIDYLETPSLAVSLSDDDLRRLARAISFKISLRRRL